MSTCRPWTCPRSFTFGLASLLLAVAGCGGGGGGGGEDGSPGGGGGPTQPPVQIQDVVISPVINGVAEVTVIADRPSSATVVVNPVGHGGSTAFLPADGLTLDANAADTGTIYLSHLGDYLVTVTVNNGGEPQVLSATITAEGAGHEVAGEVQPQDAATGPGEPTLVTDVILDWQPHPDLEPAQVKVQSIDQYATAFRFNKLATHPTTFRVGIQSTVAQ